MEIKMFLSYVFAGCLDYIKIKIILEGVLGFLPSKQPAKNPQYLIPVLLSVLAGAAAGNLCIVMLILLFLSFSLLFKNISFQFILSYIVVFFCSYELKILFSFFLKSLEGAFIPELAEWTENLFGSAASLLFLLFFVLVCIRTHSGGKNYNVYFIGTLFVTTCIVGIAMVVMAIKIPDGLLNQWILNSYLVYAIMGILFMGLGLILSDLLMNNKIYRDMDQINHQFLDAQANHYESVKRTNHEMKKFRHDLNNHLICVRHLIEENKLEESKDYINQIFEHLQNWGQTFATGNDVIDAILNEQSKCAEEKGITLNVSGCIPKALQISNYDLCVIFGNALQNAVEGASTAAGSKYVDVRLGYFNNYVNIIINNSTGNTSKNLKTTKSDRANHGFGLINLYQSVKKLSADVKIQQENDCFIIDLLIRDS
ncbi:MAG: GHKL domain-containing protein [Clostridiaceae bacterium]|nr:GHKL domain-containing protein [Clostridiaceae bacterium]